MLRSIKSKIKYLIVMSVFIAALLSGCTAASADTDASATSNPKLMEDIELALSLTGGTYNTHTVTTADITSTHLFEAVTDFFYMEDIVFPYKYGKIILSDTYANYGTSYNNRRISVGVFKKGEPIARYRLYTDPLRIEELEAELKKTELKFDAEVTPKKAELDKLKHLTDTATSVDDILYYKSLYDKSLNEYNELITSYETYLTPIKEELEFYATTESEFDICSPGDGVVMIYTDSYGEDTIISYGDVIGHFSVQEGITLNMHDNNIRYDIPVDINFGTHVDVKLGFGSNEVKVGGKVIGAPNALYTGSMFYAAVAFDDYYNAINTIGLREIASDSYINATHTIADEALVVPANAVELIINPATNEPTSKGKVTMYNDGVPYKTIVTYIYRDSKNYWITSGLKVGDVIVIP